MHGRQTQWIIICMQDFIKKKKRKKKKENLHATRSVQARKMARQGHVYDH